MATETIRRCPFCAEEIQPAAVKCRHCGEWLNDAREPSSFTAPTGVARPSASAHSSSGDSARRQRVSTPAVPTTSLPTSPTTPAVNAGPSPKPPTHPLAIAALLTNLLGVPIGTVLALTLGHKAMREIKSSQGRRGGWGLALLELSGPGPRSALLRSCSLASVSFLQRLSHPMKCGNRRRTSPLRSASTRRFMGDTPRISRT